MPILHECEISGWIRGLSSTLEDLSALGAGQLGSVEYMQLTAAKTKVRMVRDKIIDAATTKVQCKPVRSVA